MKKRQISLVYKLCIPRSVFQQREAYLQPVINNPKHIWEIHKHTKMQANAHLLTHIHTHTFLNIFVWTFVLQSISNVLVPVHPSLDLHISKLSVGPLCKVRPVFHTFGEWYSVMTRYLLQKCI